MTTYLGTSISWRLQFLSAQRSKDPRTQVGACIVNPENKIVGIGYNGMPIGCNDDIMPWGRNADDILDTKQLYVCHAELNAVLNKNSADVKNCRIYVALFPCNECAKVVIQSGIKEVIYYSDKYSHKKEFIASRRLLDTAGITCRQYQPERRRVVIDFSAIEGRDHSESTSPAETAAVTELLQDVNKVSLSVADRV
ncbi:hypothetical protein BaRGS_00033441 [Batillaria attramentaria]|uniref:dCMP deaminase n=1 Tax=Batillaria attramentaria TaxID=370345 RepID=A0ABD0JJZ2_9CAEN